MKRHTLPQHDLMNSLRFDPTPHSFFVEEIASYLPSGEGTHTYVWLKKQDLTTMEAVRRLAELLNVAPRDIGYAGMKDRHATTWQWLSIPDRPPEDCQRLAIPAHPDGGTMTIEHVALHGNKLRVGHNRGNRFTVRLAIPTARRDQLQAEFSRLMADGVPNRFGHQRFGQRGDNVDRALRILRREQREPNPRRRKLMFSALQSHVFNTIVERRLAEGTLRTVLRGDVLQKTESGGLFVSEDPDVDQPRLERGEVVITGPMPGARMAPAPLEGTRPAQMEAEALAPLSLTDELMANARRDMPGARRPFTVPLGESAPLCEPPHGASAAAGSASSGEFEALDLSFTLPSGAYATVVLETLGIDCANVSKTLPPSTSDAASP